MFKIGRKGDVGIKKVEVLSGSVRRLRVDRCGGRPLGETLKGKILFRLSDRLQALVRVYYVVQSTISN